MDIRDSDRPLNTARRVDPSVPEGALVHARDLDKFRLPDGRPDPRGWSVRSADGKKLGKVEDLLVDTASNQVRYLEIDVDDDVRKAGGRDFALVPIGAARLDDDRDDVVVNLTPQDLCDVPAYDRQRPSRDYERSLRGFLDERPNALANRPADMSSNRGGDFYANPYYDARAFDGSRRSTSAAGMGSGAADRATTSGIGDRLADAADNVKDRVDGNPASRPGPDATDRPISAGGATGRADSAWERTKDAASNVGNRVANAADNVKDRIDGNPASRPGPDATDRRG
jgi:photosynthetic reaction center H subunit